MHLKRYTISFCFLFYYILPGSILGFDIKMPPHGKVQLKPEIFQVLQQRRNSHEDLPFDPIYFEENKSKSILYAKSEFNFGFTDDYIWLATEVRSQENTARTYILEIAYPTLDRVDVALMDSDRISQFLLGEDFLSEASEIPGRNPALRLDLKPGEIKKLVLRIRSEGTIRVPIFIWDNVRFAENERNETMLICILVGGIFFLAIYNLFLWYSIRDSLYFYLALHGFSLGLVQLVFSGIAGTLIWPKYGAWWINNSNVIFSSMAQTFLLIFCLSFLKLREKKIIYYAFVCFSVISLFSWLPIVFDNYRLAVKLQGAIMGTGFIFYLILSFLRMRENFYGARFFFAALMVPTILYTSLAMNNFGIATNTLWVISNPVFSSALMMVFFSIALADHINALEKQKELSQIATIEQQRMLNEAFARFVPRPFLQILGKKSIPDVVLGDYTEREMTILFADIRGFTSISERLGPKETFEFINNYLRNAGPAIRNNGGFIDKYMGDGILALFEKRSDAIFAALRIQERNARMNRKLAIQGNQPDRLHTNHSSQKIISSVNLGIGIHTGQLMLGTIGEPQRMDGTVISDAVNLASRVESLTKQYGVDLLVTEEVLADIKLGTPEFPWAKRFIDLIAVKGKSESATIYEIISLKNGNLTKYSEKWLLLWKEAIQLYYSRDFTAAIRLIDSLLKEMPGDIPALLFRERSKSFIVNPPPPTWQGVVLATQK